MSDLSRNELRITCPIQSDLSEEVITLAYGEGGRLTRQLIRDRILPRFGNPMLGSLGDSSTLMTDCSQLAFTTDSFTVTPLFFPGGDIGKLAVCGTVNDLAVSGAVPRWLSLSLIIEEGLPWSVLDRVLDSIQAAAASASVMVVTGDTKVVPRGTADGMFITTSGIGEFLAADPHGPQTLSSGDVLIVSGPIGCHGAAVLCAREQFDFEPPPQSDCASVATPLIELQESSLGPIAVRDATRGGVAAVLHEWAEACRLTCVIKESAVPVNSQVRAVCELLGLDPMHLANEGTFVLATRPDQVDATLQILRKHDVSRHAVAIGQVSTRRIVPVVVVRSIGREIALDEPSGAPLPRIC